MEHELHERGSVDWHYRKCHELNREIGRIQNQYGLNKVTDSLAKKHYEHVMALASMGERWSRAEEDKYGMAKVARYMIKYTGEKATVIHAAKMPKIVKKSLVEVARKKAKSVEFHDLSKKRSKPTPA